MLTNKQFLCTILIGFFLFNASCIDIKENVDSFRTKINAESVYNQFDLADYYSHADGLVDIYPFDDCYYVDIYIFTSMKQTQYHFILNEDIAKGYVEEFTYSTPYDPTDWTISPVKDFLLNTSELNTKNSHVDRMVSVTLEMIEKL